MAGLTRREFVELVVAAAASTALPWGCGGGSDTFFTAEERAALARLADYVLPPDDQPGGSALGAVGYIEQLMTAFAHDPPRIHAGGPYSGRTPFPARDGSLGTMRPENDFATFMPLSRVAEAGWRLRLYGSAGVAGGGPNDAVLGPVIGWRDSLRKGLVAVRDAAGAPVATLDDATLDGLWRGLDADFRDTLAGLVAEAAFAAPEYGGNLGGRGWALAHFEGDSQPLGYATTDADGNKHERADAPLSTGGAADPEPLSDDVRGVITAFATALGGRAS